MPKFAYAARDGQGASLSGELVAPDYHSAVRLLRAEGKYATRIEDLGDAPDAAADRSGIGGRFVRKTDAIGFAIQLGIMVDTGVPLSDALPSTVDQMPAGAFKRVVMDVIDSVQGGAELSTALARHPKVFDVFFVNMVRASEATGTSGAMLKRVADYMVREREVRRRVVGAMLYPGIMLLVAIAVVIFLMTYVMPKFTAIYAGKHAVLPAPTRVLIAVSDWLVAYWWLWSSSIVAAVAGLVLFFRSARGRPIKDWISLHLPIIGSMMSKSCMARSLHTMGTLISSGVSMLDTIRITRGIAGNLYYERLWDEVADRVRDGQQLSEPLFRNKLLPRTHAQIVRAGERTGQIGPAMQKLAEHSESELRDAIATATKFIEPALMVFMGLVVGGIAIALLLPIFSISKVIAH